MQTKLPPFPSVASQWDWLSLSEALCFLETVRLILSVVFLMIEPIIPVLRSCCCFEISTLPVNHTSGANACLQPSMEVLYHVFASTGTSAALRCLGPALPELPFLVSGFGLWQGSNRRVLVLCSDC